MSTAPTRRSAANPCAPRRRGRPAKGERPAETGLIDAAARAFAEHGFEGASLRAIAAAADVDPALIAYRHGGKLALWRAVIEDYAEEVRTALDAAPDAPEGRLPALVDALARLACRRPELALLVLREAATAGDCERAAFIRDHLTRPIHDLLRPLVADDEALRAPQARADPDVRIFAMLGAVCMIGATRASLEAFTPIACDEARLRAELLRGLGLTPRLRCASPDREAWAGTAPGDPA